MLNGSSGNAVRDSDHRSGPAGEVRDSDRHLSGVAAFADVDLRDGDGREVACGHGLMTTPGGGS